MVNNQRSSRLRAGNGFMSKYGRGNRSQNPSTQPYITNYNSNFLPSDSFASAQYSGSIDLLFTERAYLLSSLQREDRRTTSFLEAIADINARIASTRPKDARALKKRLDAKKHSAEMSMRQEQSILRRLGEVTFMIQQEERWDRVERERNIRISVGTEIRMGMGVETNNHNWNEWNGVWTRDGRGQGQEIPYRFGETHAQDYFSGHEWSQQLPMPGYMMDIQGASIEGGKLMGVNGWQLPAPIDGSSGWGMSQVSGNNVTMQKSPKLTKSDSMLKIIDSRRGAWSRMSVPNLGSGSWDSGGPRYLGYFSYMSSHESNEVLDI